jgi:phosphoribosylformylglycinamidine synthase
LSLEEQELSELKSKIGRDPTSTELQIVAAEWSEHCSYKSSKRHLKMLPMKGPLIINEKGYDSGVLDVGDGYVVTAHIESHNHPSAVEPYGGAATGVGGVIRDILSAGTRPVAIFDGLRFGDIEKDLQARWLFKNAVTGIADYGNCLGIPTIGGEVEFDECYQNYALVDVAALGFGKKENLIKNHAKKGDLVVLMGGSTGRDGIGGSQFASDSLESEDRSAVQIPDPFIEKLIIEAVLEARNDKLIHAMKDLGGGGLSCAISETADALEIGIEMDVDKVHTRESDMTPEEIMISESQERMLIITSETKLKKLEKICKKFSIDCSVIGHVKFDNQMHFRKGKRTVANLPTDVVANATLLDLPSTKPAYLKTIETEKKFK